MARRVRLHIGTHKTGTTALQIMLQKLAPALAARGWHYLSGGPNHSWLYLLFVEAPHREHDMVKRGLGSPTAARAWVAERRALLADELDREQGDVLVSGEELCRLPANGVAALLTFLAKHSSDIAVVCCVRAPLDYCISEAQESIKGGQTMAEVFAHPPVARYRSALAAYVKFLSPSRVHILRYEGRNPANGFNTTERVLTAAGISTDGLDLAGEPHANVSLSREAATLLSYLNSMIPMYIEGALNPVRVPIPPSWLRRLGSTRFTLPRESLAWSLAEAQDDLRWLRSLVGEDWFAGDDAAAIHALGDDSASAEIDSLDRTLSGNVAAVLHDAAALVRDCMTSVLAERLRKAEMAGDVELAARYRADLYHIKPILEYAGRYTFNDRNGGDAKPFNSEGF